MCIRIIMDRGTTPRSSFSLLRVPPTRPPLRHFQRNLPSFFPHSQSRALFLLPQSISCPLSSSTVKKRTNFQRLQALPTRPQPQSAKPPAENVENVSALLLTETSEGKCSFLIRFRTKNVPFVFRFRIKNVPFVFYSQKGTLFSTIVGPASTPPPPNRKATRRKR